MEGLAYVVVAALAGLVGYRTGYSNGVKVNAPVGGGGGRNGDEPPVHPR